MDTKSPKRSFICRSRQKHALRQGASVKQQLYLSGRLGNGCFSLSGIGNRDARCKSLMTPRNEDRLDPREKLQADRQT